MSLLFGLFFVQRGRIGTRTLTQALERQRRNRPLIGQLALTEHLLGFEEIDRVLDAQRTVEAPFGETAIRLGLLTRAQLEHLLALQDARTPRLADVLIKLGAIDRDDVAGETTAFRASVPDDSADAAEMCL